MAEVEERACFIEEDEEDDMGFVLLDKDLSCPEKENFDPEGAAILQKIKSDIPKTKIQKRVTKKS